MRWSMPKPRFALVVGFAIRAQDWIGLRTARIDRTAVAVFSSGFGARKPFEAVPRKANSGAGVHLKPRLRCCRAIGIAEMVETYRAVQFKAISIPVQQLQRTTMCPGLAALDRGIAAARGSCRLRAMPVEWC